MLVACDLDKKPTHLEALHALKTKIEREHMCEGHQHDHRAVERRKQIGQEQPAASTSNAFDIIRAGEARRSLLQQKKEADKAEVADAKAAMLKAVERHEKAEETAKASAAALAELGRPAKKARTAPAAAGTADGGDDDSDDDAAAEAKAKADDARGWRTWDLSRWRKHEKESLNRRAVPIAAAAAGSAAEDRSLPEDESDESDGDGAADATGSVLPRSAAPVREHDVAPKPPRRGKVGWRHHPRRRRGRHRQRARTRARALKGAARAAGEALPK